MDRCSISITQTRLFKYIENFTLKNWIFSDKKKNSDIFHISAQNIDCGYSLEPPRRGSSNEYPQSMYLSRNKKNNIYPCKPQLYYIIVGFKGIKTIKACFRDAMLKQGPDFHFEKTVNQDKGIRDNESRLYDAHTKSVKSICTYSVTSHI